MLEIRCPLLVEPTGQGAGPEGRTMKAVRKGKPHEAGPPDTSVSFIVKADSDTVASVFMVT